MPRTSIKEAFRNVQQDGVKPRKIANNTFRYKLPDGSEVTRLHYTDIAKRFPDGRVELNSGGWKTVTTKDRISAELPAGYSLYSIKGVWTVSRSADGAKLPFYDGMIIPDAFESAKLQAKAEKQGKAELALKKQIKKFVCDTIPASGPIPTPDAGDCFFCSMFDADKPATRETNGLTVIPPGDRNPDHLAEHIKESYMPGSLIRNALRSAGMGETGIAMQFAGHFGGSNADVRRRVARYLQKRLGATFR